MSKTVVATKVALGGWSGTTDFTLNPSSDQSGGNVSLPVENSKTGTTNPRWRYQIANGYNATTHFTGLEYRVTPVVFSAHEYWKYKYNMLPWRNYTTWKECSGQFVGTYAPSASIASNLSEYRANSIALSKFVRQARRAQTTFQGGVFLGELGEAIRTIKSPVKSLRRGILRYFDTLKKRGRRARRLSAKDKRRILGETWLEYVFGWVPLINDIDEGAEALAQILYERTIGWKRINGSGTDEFIFSNDEVQVCSHGPNVYMREKYFGRVYVKYYGAVDLRTGGSGIAKKIGLDLSSFLPTAWELVPWSFLIDYFSNIGEIVSAASYARSDIRWMAKTVVKEVGRTWDNPRIQFSSSSYYNIDGGGSASPGEFVVKSVSRGPYYGSIIPSLVLSTPGSGMRWLNIAALSAAARGIGRSYR